MYSKRKLAKVNVSPVDRLKCVLTTIFSMTVWLIWLRSLTSICLLLFACLSPVSFAASQNNETQLVPRNILFSHLSKRDGLSQASVTSITQDLHGFIWFGTQEGLNRYDGAKIEVFEYDHENQDSLSHDWIWSLLPDESGGVWIATNGGGLNRFDSEQKKFTHFRHDPQDSSSLSSDKVRVVYKDGRGILWVGTDGGGLNRLDVKTGTFSRYLHDPLDINSLSNNRVLTITGDRHGDLWIGTRGGGLDRLDTDTGKFSHFRHDPDNETSLSHDRVRVVYQDRAGSIWAGTYEGGLNRYDPQTNGFTRFQHDPKNPNSLSNDRVREIFQDSQGTLWIATDDGLNEWRENQQAFVHYNHDTADPNSLSNARVSSVFQDRGGVLWVGTFNGINKWNYGSESFTYFQEAGTKYKLSSNIITAITESEDGALWIGTFGGGLNKLDLVTGDTTYYRKQATPGQGLNDDRIMSLYVGSQQMVWLGTRSGGLNRFDPSTGQFSYFKHDPEDKGSLSSNGIASIYGDPDGALWVGTYGGGLNRRDPLSGKFKAYRHDPKNPSTISSDRVMAIYRDRTGGLWIGTEDGGLNRFEASTETFIRYQHDVDNPQSLANNTAWAILETKQGDLWVGTDGGGVNRWSAADREKGKVVFKEYRKNDGLPSDSIMAMLEDNQGKIWLSSNRGLAQLDPESGNVRHFSQNNGLRDDNFNFAARYVNQQGQLMFGSLTGVVSFFPQRMSINQHQPPIVLRGHTRNGDLPTSYSNIPQKNAIELSYKDELVVFEFSGMDFWAPEKNLYRYQLEGFDESWSEPVPFRRTTYTNLPMGQYRFKVMAANNDGVWNPVYATLAFEVFPPPWMSRWAYALYILFAVGMIFSLLQAQSNKLKRETKQRIDLEQQVQLRTYELAERNGQLSHLNHALEKLSSTDALTGLRNRRYVQEYMHGESGKIQRLAHGYQHQRNNNQTLDISPGLSLMMIDLDGFKGINDQYGHSAGDKVLLQVRDILQQCCRTADTISRWGGDEFLLICRDTSANAVERLAERIRDKLAAHRYQLGQGNIGRISGSIGYAQYPFCSRKPDLISWEQVTIIADRAAYLAKQNGRNAWVGLYSSCSITKLECSQITDQLQRLTVQQRVKIKSSVDAELVFDNQVKRQVN